MFMFLFETFRLGCVLTVGGKCDPNIITRTEKAKVAFQKPSKALRNRNNSLETKKRVLNCTLTSILLYVSEFWTISRQIEATEMWVYKRTLRIPGSERVSSEEVLRKNGNKKNAYNHNQKETAEISWIHNEEERLGEFETPRAKKKGRGSGSPTWPEKVRATRDSSLWRAMIAHVPKGHGHGHGI